MLKIKTHRSVCIFVKSVKLHRTDYSRAQTLLKVGQTRLITKRSRTKSQKISHLRDKTVFNYRQILLFPPVIRFSFNSFIKNIITVHSSKHKYVARFLN